MIKFGYRLKQLRNKEGLTQQELADILHISRSSVAGYENGQRIPNYSNLKAIANYFDVTVDYLIVTNITNDYPNNTTREGSSNTRISDLRKNKDLSQAELSKKLNLSQQAISKYENGTREPDNKTLISIAHYFDVTTDYLLGISDIKNPYTEQKVPTSFNNAEEAMKFILKDNTVMAHGGFDINKLTDDEVIGFANELLNQLKLLSYKYKK